MNNCQARDKELNINTCREVFKSCRLTLYLPECHLSGANCCLPRANPAVSPSTACMGLGAGGGICIKRGRKLPRHFLGSSEQPEAGSLNSYPADRAKMRFWSHLPWCKWGVVSPKPAASCQRNCSTGKQWAAEAEGEGPQQGKGLKLKKRAQIFEEGATQTNFRVGDEKCPAMFWIRAIRSCLSLLMAAKNQALVRPGHQLSPDTYGIWGGSSSHHALIYRSWVN